ncbi:hypothetical protein MMC07_000262 [Pseudocyphellaria aurata]|nr:hypothetical protein [Pseudocyphellaria aurata]
MLYLLVNYTFYVIPLYDPINSRTTLPELLGQNAVKLSLSRECHRQQVDAETYDRLLEEVLAENKLKLRSKWISDLRSTASSTNNLKTLRLLYTISLAPLLKTLRLLCTLSLAPLLEILRLLCKFSHAPLLTGMLPNHTPRDKDPVVSFATTGYHESYLSQIPWIFFEISYGLTQLVYYRWLLAHGLKDSVNQMTFGQIMPLFLLALPVLAAAETYYGSHDPFEPSIQRGDVVNSRGNLISDPSTDSGSPILNDPHRTVSQSQNESCAKQTNETQASYSADVSKEISGQLTTLYKKPGMLSLLRIQFLYFSVLLIGAGITANFVGIYSFVFVCIFGIPWLIPHIYKVCSYMTSVRTQLQAELQKTSPGNGAPRQPDTSSSAPRSRPEWLAVSADNISDISKSPTATENPSTRLANQPNTVSTERPSSQIPRALSEGSSMASPKSASPAPSLDIVDAADADRQLEGPRHVLPEDDDYTHKLSERQDTEADLGVVPDRQIPAAKSSLAVPNRRVRAFSIHKWPRLEGFLQSARSAGRRRQTTP